jgi:UDP-glucose 4-epimerase
MPVYPMDLYSETRCWMERLAAVYRQLRGVESVGLRFFSVYGPREQHKGRFANLVTQFIWAVKHGEEPVIYGDGSQTRDFVWVGDVVEACVRAMASDVSCGVFNVGTGVSYSLNQVLSKINALLGLSVGPRYVANPVKNYVHDTLADTSRAESILGFKASIDLDEGIRRMINASCR